MLAKFLFYLSIILILQGYPMTAFTDYTENAIANHIFRGIAFTMPAALYAALFCGHPGETGSVTQGPAMAMPGRPATPALPIGTPRWWQWHGRQRGSHHVSAGQRRLGDGGLLGLV